MDKQNIQPMNTFLITSSEIFFFFFGKQNWNNIFFLCLKITD